MKTLEVALGDRSYPIYIGRDLIRPHVAASQVMVVSNETVAPLYLQRLKQSLDGFKVREVILPDGEQYKNLEVWNRIFNSLLESRFNRKATLAACYQRGIPFIQVPTTLLSQVDSSVGGKTGINHPLGKNMIGAFYQPQCVLADTDTLDTLEDRELSAGVAEVIKYGLIRDPAFFNWLEDNVEKLLERDHDALAYAIERSCQNKAEVVAADELESGQRALLNLGHTFGHAIETGMGYGAWLHGEAVGAGMCMAADLSHRMGWLSQQELERTIALIKRGGLPVNSPAGLSTERYLELMSVDKKVLDGGLRLVLLRAIGKSVVSGDFDAGQLRNTLNEYSSQAN